MKNYVLSSALLATSFLTLFSPLQAGWGEFELRNTTGMALRVQGTDSKGYSKDFEIHADPSQSMKITGDSNSILQIPNLRKQFKETAGGDQKKEDINRGKYHFLDVYDRMVQNHEKPVLPGGWLSLSDTFILTQLPKNSTHWLLREVTEDRFYTINPRKYKALIGFEVVADPDFPDEELQKEPMVSSMASLPAATTITTVTTMALDNADEGEKEPITAHSIVTMIPEIEVDQPAQVLDTAFFQSKDSIELTPTLIKAIQEKLGTMTVEENPMEKCNPTPGSKVIRRTWEEYTKKFGRRAIVLQSGHQGGHGRTYNTSQTQEYYMIDQCWEEVKPDAVLDVNNPRHLAYIPSGEVDLIVSDDSRGLSNEAVSQFARVLKIGGKTVFKPGTGMGWPAYEYSGYNTPGIQFDESGRYAWSNNYPEINRIHKSKDAKDDFVRKALELAVPYYTQRGYSQVEYNEESKCFVLTK